MGKRKLKAKRSLSSLPKGLAVKNSDGSNPFEVNSRQKRPKHEVHNRKLPTGNKAKQPSALAEAVQRRQNALKAALLKSKKSNVFDDKRIGEYNRQMTADEKNLTRLVKERSRQSKRSTKFSLGDDDEVTLTHRGKSIGDLNVRDHVILSDDEDAAGDLDAADTTMHFGGGGQVSEDAYYGSTGKNDMSNMYSSRKTELDELIMRRKIQKAEKVKSREDQVDAFEQMDESFAELSKVLSYRDKELEIRKHLKLKRAGELASEDQEFEDWDKEMKTYQFIERKVKATDRTKTEEEVAKEESKRLHELETRRLARMNGDFDDDELSDVSDTESSGKPRRSYKKIDSTSNADAIEDSDDEADKLPTTQTHFTADGLVEIDNKGQIIGKVGQPESSEASPLLPAGTKVTAYYHADQQYDDEGAWFPGTILSVNESEEGSPTYYIEYDDGDFEENVKAKHVKVVGKSTEDVEEEETKEKEVGEMKRKRLKAKARARTLLPFVFEAPTTLEALHEMIAAHASTGAEASLIIQRIHASNSVRLDRRNSEKMHNFYDIVLRRLALVGDAVYTFGDGGKRLDRYTQLDELTKVLYGMSQDSPEIASTVWGRRLGIFQNAHAKRLRDSEFERDEEFTAWPSMGTICSLRALGHIFPVTDMRHPVVTPAVLFLGQVITQTPIFSHDDLVAGVMCCSLIIEYTSESKRIAPEALAFISDLLRLYSSDQSKRIEGPFLLPNIALAASSELFESFRAFASIRSTPAGERVPRLSMEKDKIASSETPAALLYSALHLIEEILNSASSEVLDGGREALSDITQRVLELKPSKAGLRVELREKILLVADSLGAVCQFRKRRPPLQTRGPPSKRDTMIKSLAPRMENPDKYSLSKDKGKSAAQTALDRTRREYRREHKAVSRELRLDSAFVERARREESGKKDSAAKAKRQKAFAWLEGEQAAMNQQVRMGGGLLKGGGMGAAKAKAASGQMGMKKGKLKK